MSTSNVVAPALLAPPTPASPAHRLAPRKLATLLYAAASSARVQVATALTSALIALTEARLPVLAIGALNRVAGRPLRSVFICYPASALYARKYIARWAEPIARWRLFPIGLMRQPGGWGVVFATSTTESDLLGSDRPRRLEPFIGRMNAIAKALSCDTVSMSGILPSTCLRYELDSVSAHARRSVRTTALIAMRAALDLATSKGIDPTAPVVVLGGHGAVGQELVVALREKGRAVAIWDRRGDARPEGLDAKTPVVVIDVSRPGALKGVAVHIPSKSVVLSDVYPEPTASTARRLSERDIELFHLSGIEGRIAPTLPGAYRDVVPCCAAIEPNGSTPIVRAINGNDR